jgi:hypothetical protein
MKQHSVISQETGLFITTDVRTADPTFIHAFIHAFIHSHIPVAPSGAKGILETLRFTSAKSHIANFIVGLL